MKQFEMKEPRFENRQVWLVPNDEIQQYKQQAIDGFVSHLSSMTLQFKNQVILSNGTPLNLLEYDQYVSVVLNSYIWFSSHQDIVTLDYYYVDYFFLVYVSNCLGIRFCSHPVEVPCKYFVGKLDKKTVDTVWP